MSRLKKTKYKAAEFVEHELRKIGKYIETSGSYTKLADKMTEICKGEHAFSRQHVYGWFDKNRKVQPSWGIGILLTKAYEALLRESIDEIKEDGNRFKIEANAERRRR